MKRYIALLMIVSPVCLFAQEAKEDSLRKIDAGGVTVTAERTYSAASDAEFRAADFTLRPRNSAQDMLRIVPGLFIAQHAGGGKAEQIFLRGFDCDHGTDINISVDDAPVNMVSHGHGQGYADLHFVIPETIGRVDVAKGPYFARFGDLATAGAVVFNTVDDLSSNIVKVETATAEYSSEIKNRAFSTIRALVLVQAPFSDERFGAYVGAEAYSTNGYFDLPQDFHRLNLIAKATAAIGEDGKLTGTMLGFNSSWNANGQVPERAVSEGLISRFGSIDSTEGGNTYRTSAILKFTSGERDPFTLTASLTKYHFQLWSDFTFFAADTIHGDEIEQTDSRTIFFSRAEKLHTWIAGDAIMKTRIGANIRNDNIDVGLYHDTARLRLSVTADAHIAETQIGPYAEQEIILPGIQIQAGLRVDYFHFQVASNVPAAMNPSGNISQALASPKLNIAIPAGDEITFFGNSGFGFHSNDARAVVTSKNDNLIPRAFGAEFGARIGKSSDLISGSLSFWRLDLASEYVWNGDDGTTSSLGRTRRQGMDLELRVAPFQFLSFGGDMTVSHGWLRDAPAEENFIPLAPNLTMTANALFHGDNFSAALRLRMIDDRPANSDNSIRAQGYSLFDLSLTRRINRIELFANIENLFNVSWNEAQFDTDARLRGESAVTSDLHFTAGTPRSLHLGIGYKF